VRITDVTVALHDRTSPTLDVFGVPDGRLPMVLSIRTDEGLEGNNFIVDQIAIGEDYAAEAVHWRDQGWKGYKVHPARAWREGPALPVDADIEICRAVREAVGDDMDLMLDSTWGYSYAEALRVGLAIQELGFLWYEDPLPPNDLHGYVRLK
jgi:L-alanine-DL-glutamate epimerase-like enolase superfamily enzyme